METNALKYFVNPIRSKNKIECKAAVSYGLIGEWNVPGLCSVVVGTPADAS